ncbi:MAG: hormogonium polysaccharide biosynthesis protein HpsA [Cyanobacteria bacterium J06649_4]
MSADKQTRNRKTQKPRSDFQRLSRRFMSGLLRSLFLINISNLAGQAGFVIPTTVLLLLVMTLTVGALSFRSASRTQSTFLAREQQVIDNVAAPAADRAKSKLEYLFSRDSRFPGSSTPSSDLLVALMGDVDAPALGVSKLGTDPYTFPGETRIDINSGGLDNAWRFTFDLNGDGKEDPDEVVAYSILMDDAVDNNSTPTPGDRSDDIKIEDELSATKANALVTRNGPINTDKTLASCGTAREPDQGWFPISTSSLEKNFQITAYVSNGKQVGRANSALELQQVRRATKGNQWGAWFKYDIEVLPGPELAWNGAMHSDGSLFVNAGFKGHMISSQNSCLYSKESSAVTLAEVNYDSNPEIDPAAGDFQGQLVVGSPKIGKVKKDKNPELHIYNSAGGAPLRDKVETKLTINNDSIEPTKDDSSGENNKLSPSDISLDPLALFTQNVSKHRKTSTWHRDETDKPGENKPSWLTNPFRTEGRVINENQTPPYLDDFYRADGRYGPRPSYGKVNWVTDTEGSNGTDKQLGDKILSSDPNGDSLINPTAGLDGYWERQAQAHGLRLVVGQRLELGNMFGWAGSADPLYPPESNIKNKQRQRRTLRDNLAAVQGMVVYHYESGGSGNFPLACMAATSHPGTSDTLKNSRTFTNWENEVESPSGVTLKADFLTGNGTNGWEFKFPDSFNTEVKFKGQLANNQPLGIALRNLAHFAGDPGGGAPSFPVVQEAGKVHPAPKLAMWGDFSVLRRIFDEYLTGGGDLSGKYDALSVADKSALHSAACTMGLLSYNLDKAIDIQTRAFDAGNFTSLGGHIWDLADGDFSNGAKPGEMAKYIGRTLPVVDNGVTKSIVIGDRNGDGDADDSDDVPTLVKSNGGNRILEAPAWEDPDDPSYGGSGFTTCPDGSTDAAGYQRRCDAAQYYGQFTTEEWIAVVKFEHPSFSNRVDLARSFVSGAQLLRDRALGFVDGGVPAPIGSANNVAWNASTNLTAEVGNGNTTAAFTTGCDPDVFNTTTSKDTSLVGLALGFCADITGPKYPSLYYLFPLFTHDQDGDPDAGGTLGFSHSQIGEEYVDDPQVKASDSAGPYTYNLVGAGPADIALVPQLSSNATELAAWKLLPNPTTSSSGTFTPESMDIVLPNGNLLGLPLLEKVMYNAREAMAVRVLDIDLGRLTQEKNSDGSDYWISDARESVSGIVYAAREDAVREDAIVRPPSGTWTQCDELTEIATTTSSNKVSANCKMLPSRITSGALDPADPPLSRRADGSLIGISVKPINFTPDPDRRPYGFRLNADLGTNKGDLSFDKKRVWGLSFITDNAAYIKGDFNPHSTDGIDTLEEFKSPQTLFDNLSLDFYNGRTKDKLNTGEFAVGTKDRWRVAEVLADAVSIVSEGFVDGSVDEGFIRDRSEVSPAFNNSLTSFHNQERPLKKDDVFDALGDPVLDKDGNQEKDYFKWAGATNWFREDDSFSGSTPIWVGREGESKISSGKVFDNVEEDDDFLLIAEITNDAKRRDHLIKVPEVSGEPKRVNATMISGIVPSRVGQGYGGLHNFPRFLEVWDMPNGSGKFDATNLFIQGAFLQLNFSTASTGPFDADSWNPSDNGKSNTEASFYYKPPARRWGYDVGLQYAPAGPIAQRFVTIERPRSEHYREIPVDDPYVMSLRCATLSDGTTQVFPDESCSP